MSVSEELPRSAAVLSTKLESIIGSDEEGTEEGAEEGAEEAPLDTELDAPPLELEEAAGTASSSSSSSSSSAPEHFECKKRCFQEQCH